jgi:cytochrome c
MLRLFFLRGGSAMKKAVIGALAVVAFVFATSFVVKAGAPDEAKAMVEKAHSYLKANGKEKAFAEISNPEGQFVKGDLYVFVQDFTGVNLAHGGNPKFVGLNHSGLRDPDGVYFIKEMAELAKTKGSGWVDYKWVNPSTKKLQAKTTYVKRIEGTDSYMACGVYK